MATTLDSEPTLDIREQVARIDKMQAELGKIQVEVAKASMDMLKTNADMLKTNADIVKVRQDTRLAPWAVGFTGLGAGAALFAAGAAFTKLVIG